MPRALLLEDHKETRDAMRKSLERLDFQVDLAANASTAVKLLTTPKYDVIIMDTGEAQSKEKSYELAKKALRTNPQALMVAITAFHSTRLVSEARDFFTMVSRVLPDRTDYLAEDIQYMLEKTAYRMKIRDRTL